MKAEDIDPDQILKKLSTEDFATYDKRSLLEKLFEILKPKISEIMKIYKSSRGRYFYRGMRGKPAAFIYKPREDRRPLDTDPKIHQFFNNIYDKLTDGRINRSNSSFATSDYDTALSYGDVYVIFPYNGFYYAFSRETDDLYEFYNIIIQEYYYGTNDSYKSYTLIKYINYDKYDGKRYNIRFLSDKNKDSLEKIFQSLMEYFEKVNYDPKDKIPDFEHEKKDLVSVINKMLTNYFKVKNQDKEVEKILDNFTMDFFDLESIRRDFTNRFKSSFVFNKKLNLALQNDLEIMFRADNILALNYKYFHREIKAIIKKYQY